MFQLGTSASWHFASKSCVLGTKDDRNDRRVPAHNLVLPRNVIERLRV